MARVFAAGELRCARPCPAIGAGLGRAGLGATAPGRPASVGTVAASAARRPARLHVGAAHRTLHHILRVIGFGAGLARRAAPRGTALGLDFGVAGRLQARDPLEAVPDRRDDRAGLAADWVGGALAAVEERALWSRFGL